MKHQLKQKRCSRCNQLKVISAFGKRGNSSVDGLQGKCRVCKQECQTRWFREHPGSNDDYRKKWIANHPGRHRALEVKARAHPNATPIWADLEIMATFYQKAIELDLTVDHIVPLNSLRVCGLHNQFNLQLLTRADNTRKRNKYWPNDIISLPQYIKS